MRRCPARTTAHALADDPPAGDASLRIGPGTAEHSGLNTAFPIGRGEPRLPDATGHSDPRRNVHAGVAPTRITAKFDAPVDLSAGINNLLVGRAGNCP